jgi:hypothetical protein
MLWHFYQGEKSKNIFFLVENGDEYDKAHFFTQNEKTKFSTIRILKIYRNLTATDQPL